MMEGDEDFSQNVFYYDVDPSSIAHPSTELPQIPTLQIEDESLLLINVSVFFTKIK
jgi:hypothetical protein